MSVGLFHKKPWTVLLLSVLLPSSAIAQYYLAGTTQDSAGTPVPFVKIRLHSSGMLFESGGSGGFGIPSGLKKDSVTCIARGFDSLKTVLVSGTPNKVILNLIREKTIAPVQTNVLSSLTRNLLKDPEYTRQAWGESYNEVVENGFVHTQDFPSTGFSPNGNNASYSNIRRFINNEVVVPPDAVRMEEMLNYFSLSTASKPTNGRLFNVETNLTDCPWSKSRKLLFVTAQAKTLELDKVSPANLVFLIDNSGSMDLPNRLPLLKSAFQMLVKNLRDIDRVAIVTYGGTAAIALPPTPGSDKEKINKAIQEIVAGGATPGSYGIQLAYQLATNSKIAKGNNRVILATDGDFNVGITEEKELEALIEQYKNTGVYLTCLGVGMGNYKDSKIEVLAKRGNGNFAYLDKEAEAEKVLVKELTQNLYAVASDVTIHVDFNPALVKNYRLIGYDNRREALKDSASSLIGSEIGSGYSMVTVFEIEPADTSSSWLQKMSNNSAGTISIKAIDTKSGKRADIAPQAISFNYLPFAQTDRRLRLATAITMFGTILRNSPYAANMSFAQVTQIAGEAIDPNDALQAEFLQLAKSAESFYTTDKKKKKKVKKQDD